MVDKSPYCGKLIEMTALPQVSATETADLRDVHKRLASREHIGYFCNGAWGMWLWTVTKIYPEGF
jgi:hypothetical protein